MLLKKKESYPWSILCPKQEKEGSILKDAVLLCLSAVHGILLPGECFEEILVPPGCHI